MLFVTKIVHVHAKHGIFCLFMNRDTSKMLLLFFNSTQYAMLYKAVLSAQPQNETVRKGEEGFSLIAAEWEALLAMVLDGPRTKFTPLAEHRVFLFGANSFKV